VTTERTIAQGGPRRRPGRRYCCNLKIAIFPLRLLLFYIVYNRGKSRTAVLSRVYSNRYQGREQNHDERHDEWGSAYFSRLLCCLWLLSIRGIWRLTGQKLLPLKTRGNQAETRQDARALDARMDNSLVYTEYDGTLKPRRERQVTASMKAHVCGDTAVATGVRREKGVDPGASPTSAGATDTWIHQNGTWVCPARQYTLYTRMSH
jgi:hypothetical protein